jgi:hypothetical protein
MAKYLPPKKAAKKPMAVTLVSANSMGHCDGRPFVGMLKGINTLAQQITQKMTCGQIP